MATEKAGYLEADRYFENPNAVNIDQERAWFRQLLQNKLALAGASVKRQPDSQALGDCLSKLSQERLPKPTAEELEKLAEDCKDIAIRADTAAERGFARIAWACRALVYVHEIRTHKRDSLEPEKSHDEAMRHLRDAYANMYQLGIAPSASGN